jgi:hypothetical protein
LGPTDKNQKLDSSTYAGEEFVFTLYAAMEAIMEASTLVNNPELIATLENIHSNLNVLTYEYEIYETEYKEKELSLELNERRAKALVIIDQMNDLIKEYRAIRGTGSGGPRSRPKSPQHDKNGVFRLGTD